MRTVDALIAVRDLFIHDPQAWTQGVLTEVSESGKECFCVLGGVSKVTGCLPKRHSWNYGVGVSPTSGPYSATEGGSDGKLVPIDQLSQRVVKEFAAQGIHLKAAVNAVRYLTAAASKLHNTCALVVNDRHGFDAVLRVLDLAVRNAKRRHINGDRKKAA